MHSLTQLLSGALHTIPGSSLLPMRALPLYRIQLHSSAQQICCGLGFQPKFCFANWLPIHLKGRRLGASSVCATMVRQVVFVQLSGLFVTAFTQLCFLSLMQFLVLPVFQAVQVRTSADAIDLHRYCDKDALDVVCMLYRSTLHLVAVQDLSLRS